LNQFTSNQWTILQDTSSAEVGQELDHVIGHRGSDGQMGTRRLESVLIGNPVKFNDDTFR
jgi:hypothetical protein